MVDTAALRVLDLEPGFDLHAFAELDEKLLDALRTRTAARRPEAKCIFVGGDVNETWTSLRRQVQRAAAGGSFLTFCFVDPFRCANLKFSTLRGLAEIYLDFVILIPSFMDAHRNPATYLRDDKEVLDRFLGDRHWRDAWERRRAESEVRYLPGRPACQENGKMGFQFKGLTA